MTGARDELRDRLDAVEDAVGDAPPAHADAVAWWSSVGDQIDGFGFTITTPSSDDDGDKGVCVERDGPVSVHLPRTAIPDWIDPETELPIGERKHG